MLPLKLVGRDSMRYIMQTVGPILAAAILMGCDGEPQNGTTSTETTPQPSSTVVVVTTSPEIAALSEPIFVTGTILARRSTNISPMVGGS